MRLIRMTATFGGLQQETLRFHEGLNIITRPNEGGKSTWCAFLRTMLYGVDTKARDTRTVIADKNRYLPWSGAPMAGEVELEWRGQTILLRRSPKGNTPFGTFSATDACTGAPIPGLTAQNAGETLLGVSREVWERSAFVGQGGLTVTGCAPLEERIAALVSTGEEAVSRAKTEQTLKSWQRRRKYNKSGLIPQLEGELAACEGLLRRMAQARSRAEAGGVQREELEGHLTVLEGEMALHRLIRQGELDLRCSRAAESARRAAAELEQAQMYRDTLARRTVTDPRFPDLDPGQAQARAQADFDAAAALAQASNGWKWMAGLFIAAGLACVAAAGLTELWWLLAGAALLVAGGGVRCVVAVKQAAARRAAYDGLLARYQAESPEEIRQAAQAYQQRWQQTQEELRTASQAVEVHQVRCQGAKALWEAAVQAGGRPTAHEPQTIIPPARTPDRTEAELNWTRAKLAQLTTDEALARGELATLGDPAAEEARAEELRQALARRRQEYDAITLALEALSQADATLRARFSPQLNQVAGEYLAALTERRYDELVLSREFEAVARQAGTLTPRKAIALSQGTADQIYLAVRLAICKLALPTEEAAPILLDDALINFDDTRMALALDLLRQIAEERQILLFSCHSREGAAAADTPCHLDEKGV